MPSDATRSIDVVLSWSREQEGTTVLLKQGDDGAWDEVGRTDSTELTVRGLDRERAFVFAAAALDADGLVAPVDEWETLRITPTADEATPALPSAPTGFAAVQDGADLNFRWDTATDGVTASYELRAGDSWEDGQLVATGLTATTYSWPWSSSGEQTLYAKALDRLGRPSRDAASIAATISPLDDHVTADTSDQAASGWPGTATHLDQDGGALRSERVPLLGDLTMPIGELTFPCNASFWPVGVYETPVFDAGAVEKHRVEATLGAAQPIEDMTIGDLVDPLLRPRQEPPPFLARNTIAMAPLPPVDAKVEIDTCPTPDGAWDGWRPFAPGTYRYWRSRLRVTVAGDGRRYVRVPRLVVTRRKFNRKQEGHVVVNCSPVDVVFPTPFQNPPKVTATVLGYAGTPLVTNVTATGFTIAGGAAVFPGDPATFAPTVHWQALGT
jgi:hypothetical protein